MAEIPRSACAAPTPNTHVPGRTGSGRAVAMGAHVLVAHGSPEVSIEKLVIDFGLVFGCVWIDAFLGWLHISSQVPDRLYKKLCILVYTGYHWEPGWGSEAAMYIDIV